VPETIGEPYEHNTIMAERIKCVKRKKENVEKYTYAFTQKVGYGNIRKKYKIS